MNKMMQIVMVGLLMVGLSACKSTTVSRVDTDTVQDLSGNWNDTDSRLVSSRMVADLMTQSWLGKYQVANGKNPVVIVGEVRNLSHEHINTRTFISDLEMALINSGEVEFVASSQERQDIRDERADQMDNATLATQNLAGKELGADYMLKGQINSIFDAAKDTQVKYYQVDLTLISLADNRKVWIGQKKIKKVLESGMFR
ncbi:MAG: penicillin-binding protein activator LpoB [Zetaproteobacteria bacterium CG2_30_46_52]|nr:MAG: penicillin-binding protein activator LpoB [Zetaproteobacteria bacterium CG2_30_46_52]